MAFGVDRGDNSVMGAKPTTKRRSSLVVGWREWVALPDLGIGAIKAKIDTGARSSSLHAFDVEVFSRRGRKFVRFKVHPVQRESAKVVSTEAALVDSRSVRSSNGVSTLRPVIRTRLAIHGSLFPIELTLAGRDEMGFRMLLGREALRQRFLIDAGRSYRAGRRPRRQVSEAS